MKRRKNRVTAKLRLHPDPILTQVCEPVKDGEDVSGIIRDMMHILVNSKHGVGLAAPQAGHLKRVIIVKDNDSFHIMVNPSIFARSDATSNLCEGCLSYPRINKPIKRHTGIRVKYHTDIGHSHDAIFTKTVAIIIQHEIDHLNGKCLVGA